jgi:GrpB-like predicted nucleotidyltransferase (UPF0157 family)
MDTPDAGRLIFAIVSRPGWTMPQQIVEYDPQWPKEFEFEAQRLSRALGTLVGCIEHIGSTAVPGLPAKPIIDIQIVVQNETASQQCRPILLEHGYTEAVAPIHFFHQPAEWPHSHHVHMREYGSFEARRLRVFRDWLRTHPEDRDAYGALKLKLAESADLQRLGERVRYSRAKDAFVREIERRAGLGGEPTTKATVRRR